MPRGDTEVNTYLDRANHLLEFSYYDPSIQDDRTFRINYTDEACRTNPQTRRLIRHVLETRKQAKSRSDTFVVADCFDASKEPRRMTLACGDNGFRARQLTWSAWGRKSAEGGGVFFMNDCDPGCVVGQFRRREGQINLKEPRFCEKLHKTVFMSGTVIYEKPFQGRSENPIYLFCPP